MEDKSSAKSVLEKVEQALQTIRPYLQADGGDVRLLDMNEGIVRLELLGACGSCPMSTMTLKAGVTEAIKRVVPEVIDVEAVNITLPDEPNAQLPNTYI